MIKKLTILMALLYCGSSYAQEKLNVTHFEKQLQEQNLAQLVDVRTTSEFEDGHIPGAQKISWTNAAAFTEATKSLNKDQPIYIYCLSGGRSARAAKTLVDQGYKVFELEGGIVQWRAADKAEYQSSKEADATLSLEAYNQLIQSDTLTLVDFTAQWCAPCQKMKPYLERMAISHKDRLKVIFIDADQHKELLKSLGIQALPHLRFYKKGKALAFVNSLHEESAILQLVDTHSMTPQKP